MTIDWEKLNEGLNKLTGYDLEACERDERADTDHLKPRYYNPAVTLQKAVTGLC